MKKINVLAFGAHPDDVEACAGGLLVKAKKAGLSTGIVDFTRGEFSNFGTKEERDKEAKKAATILDLDVRENLNIPDSRVLETEDHVEKVASCIRKYKPDIILAPYFEDLHPDHRRAGKIVEQAAFFAKLSKYGDSKESPHQTGVLMYYMLHTEFHPSFVLDISDEFEIRKASLLAHTSQFYKSKDGQYTDELHNPQFNQFFEARSIMYGYKIGATYGEPYLLKSYLGLRDIRDVINGDLRSLTAWKKSI